MQASDCAARRSFQFDRFRLDPFSRTLLDGDQRVPLPSKAFDTLLALIESRGDVVDKDTLLRIVWPDTVVEENNLAQSIAAIRKALGEERGDCRYVVTVPGRGYSFAAAVAEILPPVADRTNDCRRVQQKFLAPVFAGVLVGVLIGFGLPRPAVWGSGETVTRIPLALPDGISDFSLSPDGEKLLVTTATGAQECRLYNFKSGQIRPLPAVGGGLGGTFWSPDSSSIGFKAAGQFKKLDLASGAVSTVAELKIEPPAAANPARWLFSPAWAEDGSILFHSPGQGVLKLPASAGEPVQLTRLSPPDQLHAAIYPLPGGRRFLYSRIPGVEVSLGSMDGQIPQHLFKASSTAIYAPPGYLLYLRGDLLMAQPFDARRGALTGSARPLIDGVARNKFPDSRPHSHPDIPQLSVSQTGVLVYRPGTRFTRSRLTWFDRSGRAKEPIGEPAAYASPALSPDGNRLAVTIRDPQTGNSDIWILDLERGGRSRLTFDGNSNAAAVWSPDGSQLAFTSERKGIRDLYVKQISGSTAEELLLSTNTNKTVDDWSVDGARISFSEQPPNAANVWFLPMSPRRREAKRLPGSGGEMQSHFSPDGRFLAYRSSESSRFEIYVQALAPGGSRWQISTSGGQEPQWRGDGQELYYIAWPSTLTAVKLKVTGNTIAADTPRALFDVPHLTYMRNRYAAGRDGSRFLVLVPIDSGPVPPPMIVQNWPALLAGK